ncbi:MAG: hypothetical protein HYU66_17140 [Armatimonadetes bacterium]|nr:hypothetical protein [Armatimonadota bacterium]
MATVKCYNPNPAPGLKWGRAVAVATSKDFDHWTEPVFVFGADEEDQAIGRLRNEQAKRDPNRMVSRYDDPTRYGTDVYNLPVFTYHGLYIGMPAMFNHLGPLPEGNEGGQINVELAVSRDLLTWQRVADRAIFIPVGPKQHFDAGLVLACAYPQVHGDELWFYYLGEPVPHAWDKVSDEDNAIGLATLRLDGFVSLDAGDAEGVLLTPPLVPAGPELYVNLDAPQGEARVEVLDAGGTPVPGLSDAASLAVTGNAVRLQVHWAGGADLARVAGQPVRLRFRLKQARLYAFWTE